MKPSKALVAGAGISAAAAAACVGWGVVEAHRYWIRTHRLAVLPPDARPLRILSEYLEPLSHFRRQRIRDTIVFFGSARITSGK